MGFGEGGFVFIIVEFVGLSYYGYRGGVVVGFVEEAVVGVRFWEGCFLLVVEVEGIY